MAEHIIINLDEAFFAPSCDMTLLDMIHSKKGSWPIGATCVTQESDGGLFYWSAPVDEVKNARETAALEVGLMPLIGLGEQVHLDYFLLDEQEVVAKDWKTAVVTIEQYTASKGQE